MHTLLPLESGEPHQNNLKLRPLDGKPFNKGPGINKNRKLQFRRRRHSNVAIVIVVAIVAVAVVFLLAGVVAVVAIVAVVRLIIALVVIVFLLVIVAVAVVAAVVVVVAVVVPENSGTRVLRNSRTQ